MQVIEHLERATRPFISIEIIPPRRGSDIQGLYRAIESVQPYSPPYIDVTSHAAEVMWEEMPDGSFKRRVKRKSPGTFGLCAAIKYKFGIEPVPHLLCAGFTREETEDALIELNYIGIENILCIRGDSHTAKPIPDGRSINRYAVELVEQVSAMNQGIFLDRLLDAKATRFCIGVAAYPEKHFEAPNLSYDLEQLRRKEAAGAHYAVTQMFFDNAVYHTFLDKARAAGVTLPIIPGLKILTRKAQLTSVPKAFFVNFPDELVERVLAAPDDTAVEAIGVDWAYQQAVGLLERGALNLHFYIMQQTRPFVALMERLKTQL
ncbi:MAG: methylenetetrahydrofolate reductase [Bacteroidia bacterium]|nr:methylenetetrahydrofolate reductase [Bacteroidia bacterium]